MTSLVGTVNTQAKRETLVVVNGYKACKAYLSTNNHFLKFLQVVMLALCMFSSTISKQASKCRQCHSACSTALCLACLQVTHNPALAVMMHA